MMHRSGTTADTGAEAVRFSIGESSLGRVLVAQSDRGIAAVLIGHDADALRRDLEARFPRASLVETSAEASAVAARVIRFIESPGCTLDVSLDLRGTEFQQKVWRALQDIPTGATATYTEIATRLGLPTAVRAVAAACGANPVAVVVPCHRVVRSDGGLAGYRWGVERKRTLLEREAEAREVGPTPPLRPESSTADALPDHSSRAPEHRASR